MQGNKHAEAERFTNIAQAIAPAGVSVTVEVSPLKDIKLRWQRTATSVRFSISDYMCGAPDYVVEDIFGKVFAAFNRGKVPEYSERTKAYLYGDLFAKKNRESYLKRHHAEPIASDYYHGIPVHVCDKERNYSSMMDVIICDSYTFARGGSEYTQFLDECLNIRKEFRGE